MSTLAVLGSGMVTGVGFNAAASYAAIHCGISGAEETKFMFDGEWLMGCQVPFEENWRGREKLLQMVVPSIQECARDIPADALRITPILLCVSEQERPGRIDELDGTFLESVSQRLGQIFDGRSEVIAAGKIGGVQAVARARELLNEGHPYCIIAGVDTYLVAATLADYHDKHRLLTAENSNGFVPGEAAAAVLLGPDRNRGGGLLCSGLGFGTEPAAIDSGEPLRADGLVEAITAAFADSGLGYEQLDFRITDVNGEQYGFKEAALALLRSMRVRKERFDIWHPAECTGEVGAAIVPVVLGVTLAAMRKGHTPGSGVLCHFGNDDPRRASLVLQYSEGAS